MDLLLRLITCIESPEIRRAVIEWLNEEKIVEKLVDSIVVATDEDIHCNAAQSLCDIVRLGREQFIQQQEIAEPDPLLVTMELEETVAKLLSNMFESDKNESVLVNGLCVIHTLLEVRRQGDVSDQLPNGEIDRFTQGINNVIAALVPRLKDFHNLLVEPPKQMYNNMPTSVGQLEPPLGRTRLQVAKLITALVGANMHQVNQELASLETVQTLLDLYFKYEWNNFLHTQVEQCLLIILNNGPIELDGKPEHPLLVKLFNEYNFVQRVLSEWEKNETQQNAPSGRRRGFMGHLTKMANSVSALVEKNDTPSMVKDHFNGLSEDVREKWEAFVMGSLAEINKKNTIELMRGHPLASSSEDDDADFKDIPFPQDTAMQQAFSDYQLQQMTSNFIDQFGFNDEEFAEQDEKIEAAFSDRISSIESDIQVNSTNQPSTATVFEQLCNERIQQFDNDDSDEDIWEEKPITFDNNVQQARAGRLQAEKARCNSSDEEDSTDSGEELDSPVKIRQQPTEGMDVDNPWPADSSSPSEHIAMDTSTPWDKPTVSSSAVTSISAATVSSSQSLGDDEGWADFSSIPGESSEGWADFSYFEGDKLSTSQGGPRSSSPDPMDTTENTRGSAYVVSSNSQDQDKTPTSSTLSVTVTLPDATISDSSDVSKKDLSVTAADEGLEKTQQRNSSRSPEPQPDSTSPSLSHVPAGDGDGGNSQMSSSTLDASLPSQSESSVTPQTQSSPKSSNVDAQVSSQTQDQAEGQADVNVAMNDSLPSPSSSPSPAQGSTDGKTTTDTKETQNETAEADSSSSLNQNFLAASGLLKKRSDSSPAAPTSSQAPSQQSDVVKGNGPVVGTGTSPSSPAPTPAPSSPPAASVPPTSLHSSVPETSGDKAGDHAKQEELDPAAQTDLTPAQKIELVRAQAKEAQELYDAATTVKNGPV
ncbi:serine/threonine-protein phosphatase 6 regulatory subunit 3 [Elysia marginata]|uniref:Serine/threonine-protein phosphatase 6 regulatory subunit 3 n=1 Tax=Elysia marginata TaxID=1093978 RepID=A0AAV4JY53_9GAST|nr:serine/threonine-protein phosphatase 6 regulatory subunit 3 [Elysia marginata]